MVYLQIVQLVLHLVSLWVYLMDGFFELVNSGVKMLYFLLLLLLQLRELFLFWLDGVLVFHLNLHQLNSLLLLFDKILVLLFVKLNLIELVV